MSERINVRLPDQLLLDVRQFAKQQNITITDMVISGLRDQLPSSVSADKHKTPTIQPGKDMAPNEITSLSAVQKANSLGCHYINPQPKKKAHI